MKHKIAQVVVGLPVEGPFDYLTPSSKAQQPVVGGRVLVSFGVRKIIGYVIGFAKQSFHPNLKPIIRAIDQTPLLSTSLLKLTRQFSDYYGCSQGEAIEASLPASLRRSKAIELSHRKNPKTNKKQIEKNICILEEEQGAHWDNLIGRIKNILKENKEIVLLVPEVSMAEKVRGRLESSGIKDAAVMDKRVSTSKALKNWVDIKEGKAKVIIGTRSAVFAPTENLGAIIIYDENNQAYKQEQSPCYHAREVAFMRSKIEKCVLIFVSHTPSLELWQAIKKKKLTFEKVGSKSGVNVHLVNLANYKMRKSDILSVPLRNSIEKALKENKRVLLFLNRKGFSTFTQCPHCGHRVRCPRCDTNLTYLYSKRKMVCRHCRHEAPLLRICPKCNSSYLKSSGMGAEKLESEMCRLFPQARICLFDKEKKLDSAAQILIATQSILGYVHDLAVDVIGVLKLDAELNRADFRCGEKVFALLSALKSMAHEQLIMQTRIPENYCFRAFARDDRDNFYSEELKLRKELSLPPFFHLVHIIVRDSKEEAAFEQALRLYEILIAKTSKETIDIIEPQPDIVAKLRGKYRFVVSVKGKSPVKVMSFVRKTLRSFRKKSKTIITVNVDA